MCVPTHPAGYLKDLKDVDFGAPLHCLLLAGEMHEIETQMLQCYGVGDWLQVAAAGSGERSDC